MSSLLVTLAAAVGGLLILAGAVALIARRMRLFRPERVTTQMRAIPDPRLATVPSVMADALRSGVTGAASAPRLRETSVKAWAARIVILGTPVITIGRSIENDIVLAEDAVSAEHCRLEKEGDTFRLIDLGSTNKTFVNGKPAESVLLRDGDQIRVGHSTFAFEWSSGPS